MLEVEEKQPYLHKYDSSRKYKNPIEPLKAKIAESEDKLQVSMKKNPNDFIKHPFVSRNN